MITNSNIHLYYCDTLKISVDSVLLYCAKFKVIKQVTRCL